MYRKGHFKSTTLLINLAYWLRCLKRKCSTNHHIRSLIVIPIEILITAVDDIIDFTKHSQPVRIRIIYAQVDIHFIMHPIGKVT